MFSLRLFLQNHSPILSWYDLPAEVRGVFAPPNGILVRSECFLADRERRFRFELTEQIADGLPLVCHKADVVIIQDWGLLTLVRLSSGRGKLPRVIGLKPAGIVAASLVPTRKGKA